MTSRFAKYITDRYICNSNIARLSSPQDRFSYAETRRCQHVRYEFLSASYSRSLEEVQATCPISQLTGVESAGVCEYFNAGNREQRPNKYICADRRNKPHSTLEPGWLSTGRIARSNAQARLKEGAQFVGVRTSIPGNVPFISKPRVIPAWYSHPIQEICFVGRNRAGIPLLLVIPA